MQVEEITFEGESDLEGFVKEKQDEISKVVGDGLAINALSGGVDSSVVTKLAYDALGDRLTTYFVENGLMRDGEADWVISLFETLSIPVEKVHSERKFFYALSGLTDPEEKREAITQTFYRDVFGKLVKDIGARYILQGTNYTDVEETVAGIKRQHNILKQLGIDTEKEYGYELVEPLEQLRKPSIRELAKYVGLPKEIYERPPFPGPALAARIQGEVNRKRVGIVRQATKIVEEALAYTKAFQYFPVLKAERVPGMREGKRDFGLQIELRCWNSEDAVTAAPTRLPFEKLEWLADKLTTEVPGVVSVTYNITTKPPSTIEAV